MNEKKSKRREWVKTAAIIFLAVMLVLTFFSQTIMNYSLPEVSTEYAQSGSITSKIRGSGSVESGDLYDVNAASSQLGRKIVSVAVHVGDAVKRGDVLLELAEGEGEELEAAKQTLEEAKESLESAKEAYDAKLLSKDTTAEIIQQAHSNTSAETYREQITQMQQQLQQAEQNGDDRKESLEKQIAAFTTQIEWTTDESSNNGIESEIKAVQDAEKAKESAEETLDEAKTALSEAQKKLSDAQEKGEDESALKELQKQVERADKAKTKAENALTKAEDTLKKAESNKKKKKEELLASLQNQKKALEEELNKLENSATNIEEQLTKFTDNLTEASELRKLYDAVQDAREVVAKAQEELRKIEQEDEGSQVVADIDGTITSIAVTAGNKLESTEIMVMQPEGKGYTMSFSVTNEQAKTLSVGDKAQLVNSWYYDDMDITLASIKPDKTEPGKKKMLTFDVVGDVTEGQNLNVSVGQKSANYDLIVPNSAIREDNNGKFILTVESKSSPLGNRYIATRVDVQVVASDDTKSAVTGGLYGYEFVITTATKPVEAGQQVRLANN
ncbi:MAG: hypothetical protein NC081_08650 [Roseburia sp.]|nr:hypothetical protein [Roseburia sp.]